MKSLFSITIVSLVSFTSIGRAFAQNNPRALQSSLRMTVGLDYCREHDLLATAYTQGSDRATVHLELSYLDRAMGARPVEPRTISLSGVTIPLRLSFSPDCNRILAIGNTTTLVDLATGSLKDVGSYNPHFASWRWLSADKFMITSKSNTIVSGDQVTRSHVQTIDAASGAIIRTIQISGSVLSFGLARTSTCEMYALTEYGSEKRGFRVALVRVSGCGAVSDEESLWSEPRSTAQNVFGLEIFPDRIAFSSHMRGWMADQTLYIWSISEKRVVKRFMGFLPQKIDDRRFLFKRYEGTNEEIPYLYGLNEDSERRLAPGNRFGTYSARERLSVFNDGFIARFDSNLTQEFIVKVDFSGNETVISPGISFPEDAETSIWTDRAEVMSSNGQKLPIYIFKANTRDAPKGLVLFVHGGGCGLGKQFESGYWLPEFGALARAGYLIAAVTYSSDRVSTIPSEVWREQQARLSCRDWARADVEDIFAARQMLTERIHGANAALPVFLWGHSYGGYLVNLIAGQYSGRAPWNGIISAHGVWNSAGDSRLVGYASPDEPPSLFIGDIKAPLFLVHSRLDPNVDFNQTTIFEREARRLGIPFDEPFYTNGRTHWVDEEANWDAWITRLTEFLGENLN